MSMNPHDGTAWRAGAATTIGLRSGQDRAHNDDPARAHEHQRNISASVGPRHPENRGLAVMTAAIPCSQLSDPAHESNIRTLRGRAPGPPR